MLAISQDDLTTLLAVAAWTARAHNDTLPDALVVPLGDVLARFNVHLMIATAPEEPG